LRTKKDAKMLNVTVLRKWQVKMTRIGLEVCMSGRALALYARPCVMDSQQHRHARTHVHKCTSTHTYTHIKSQWVKSKPLTAAEDRTLICDWWEGIIFHFGREFDDFLQN
jgi:hypothetical protein